MSQVAEVSWEMRTDSRENRPRWWITIATVVTCGPLLALAFYLLRYLGADPVRGVLLLLLPVCFVFLLPVLDRLGVIVAHKRMRLTASGVTIEASGDATLYFRARHFEQTLEIPWTRLRWWQLTRTTCNGKTRYRLLLPLRQTHKVISLRLPDEATATRAAQFLRTQLPAIRGKEQHLIQPNDRSLLVLLVTSLAWIALVGLLVHLQYVRPDMEDLRWLLPKCALGPGLPWAIWICYRGCRPAYAWIGLALVMNCCANVTGLFVGQLPALISYLEQYRPVN